MNIKYVLLTFLILLVPACGKKPRYATAPVVPTEVVGEKGFYDEELGAYVVKEDESKFSTAAAREEELTAASAEPTVGDIDKDSERYGLKRIYFEYDKWRMNDLRPDQKAVLDHDVDIVKSLADQGYEIDVIGHADSAGGSTEYNIALSQKRADMVWRYLKEHGVKGNLKEPVGYGSAYLIVLSGDPVQQAPNRRVEIYAYSPTA